MPHFKLMIPGATPAETPLEVRAPYDNTLIATADAADSAAVEKALATALPVSPEVAVRIVRC